MTVVLDMVKGAGAIVLWLGIGAVVIIGAFMLGKKRKEKQAFNIPVTIIIPRSDGNTRDMIHAKGGYFKSAPVGGITTFRLKRRGVGVIEMPPPSSQYLIGLNRELFLIQKGMDDFEPVNINSWKYIDVDNPGANGKKRIAVLNLKCVNQDATAWKFDNEQNAKKRFTFNSFWEKYKDFIQMTIFIMIVFIASYIQYTGLKEVAATLKQVAEVLAPAISNSPIVS